MTPDWDGSEVVIRFPPFLPDRLLENAEDTHADEADRGEPNPRYGVSVLAGRCEPSESLQDAVVRILRSTTLRGKKIAVVSGNTLRASGFQVVEDPNTLEPLHHLVGDHPFTEPPRVDVLASLMQDRMTNPVWKEGAR